ncbi:IST1-like protein, partial [Bienertia sinuspersici]
MLDVLVIIERYCILLSERVKLIQQDKECPDEVKEAISSLIFAASRCGEFPELHKIRSIFASRYGKEFNLRATQLRNNCGVNPKIIQKLSTRQPSLEDRMNMLKEVADENGISLQLEETSSMAKKDLHEQMRRIENLSLSMNRRKQYKDVAEAAQEAFLSAAYAAAAARAAVELSRSRSQSSSGGTPDYLNTSNYDQSKQVLYSGRSKTEAGERIFSREIEDSVLRHDAGYSFNSDENSEQTCQPYRKMNIEKVKPRSNSLGTASGMHEQNLKFDERVFSWEIEDSVLRHDRVCDLENYSLHSDEDSEEACQSEKMMNTEKVNPRSNSSGIASATSKKNEQNLKFDESDSEVEGEKINAIGNKDACREGGTRLLYYSHNQITNIFEANSRKDNEEQISARFPFKSSQKLNT